MFQKGGAVRVATSLIRICGNVGSVATGIASRAVSGAHYVPAIPGSTQFVAPATQMGFIYGVAARFGPAFGVSRGS